MSDVKWVPTRSYPERRDIAKEQAMICEKWKLVHANIKIDDAMNAFLSETISIGSGHIIKRAFDLVRQVLNPKGYVRLGHKDAKQSLYDAIRTPGSVWQEKGTKIDSMWDLNDTWFDNMHTWNGENKYVNLKDQTVDSFCSQAGQKTNRDTNRTYARVSKLSADIDVSFPICVINKNGDFIPQMQEECRFPLGFTRWEKYCADYKETEERLKIPDASDRLLSLLEARQKLEPYWRFALRTYQRLSKRHNAEINECEEDKKPRAQTTVSANVATNSETLLFKSSTIAKFIAAFLEKDSAVPNKPIPCDAVTCKYRESPDLILSLGYFSEETGLYLRRCVVCEIETDQKETKRSDIKLALKLMTSTSAQACLQDETYHIRSNFRNYSTQKILNSLLSTTNVELPEFQNFLDTLDLKGEKDTVTQGIHLVHHMFLSHVKVAFLIHMRVLHGIDMLTTDEKKPDMRDHHFFVNYEGINLPNALYFQDTENFKPTLRNWLESENMLHARVKIKCCEDEQILWKPAPVVNASSSNASMQKWSAAVRCMHMVDFPFEEISFMPIACATVQRVNMAGLKNIVDVACSETIRDYQEALRLIGSADTGRHRLYADRCFLTRNEQLNRSAPWNTGDMAKLRQHKASQNNDLIEFDFQFEAPVRTRNNLMSTDVVSAHLWKKWDQISMRMYYFNKHMQKTEWKKHTEGMWYIQDYMNFMTMIQTLKFPEIDERVYEEQTSSESEEWRLCATGGELKKPSKVCARACQRFSVLSWFFDCRDAGACGYQWENFVLDYFGVNKNDTEKSDFEDFSFSPIKNKRDEDAKYFGQPWFEICVFLEHNFRNALAPMHYKLSESESTIQKSISELQGKVKVLYNQRKTLFNQRSCFEGLGFRASDGSIFTNKGSFLSFQEYNVNSNANMTLRERIFSKLNDELPVLDRTLLQYVRQFRIPDVEIFLRMIRCPNILALRELAVQHRHLLGGQGTASSVQPENHIQNTLKFFPIAVQSEILYLLQFVERDDSVFVHVPVVQQSSHTITPKRQMRQWIRETLEVSANVQTLKTPLQLKCYMFTMPERTGGGVAAFHVLKKLFYTTESMMNTGSQRSIVFVLLQIHLALEILKQNIIDTNQNFCNPLYNLLDETDEISTKLDLFSTYEVSLTQDMLATWTMGASRTGWPRRDLNRFCLPFKRKLARTSSQQKFFDWDSTVTQKEIGIKNGLDSDEESVGLVYSMLEKERCRWLLLLYARPGLDDYITEDNTVVCKQHERRNDGRRQTCDTITARLSYEMKDRLQVYVCDDRKNVIFFEKLSGNAGDTETPFPEFIEAIITEIPDRSLIYVPKKFAQQLRKDYPNLHETVFTHDNGTWKMVCVGVRAWAWKRLLVKSIFFDALTKIMTRSSVQLSLYQPFVESLSVEDSTSKYREAIDLHGEIKDVFGDLEYKMNFMQSNVLPKKVQLILTVCDKKIRGGCIGSQNVNVYTTLSPLVRQMKWIEYCLTHKLKDVIYCRYMLVDNRFVNYLKKKYLTTPMKEEDVIFDRLYVFIVKPQREDMMIEIRDKIYLLCPKGYGSFVLDDEDEIVTGKLEHSDTTKRIVKFFEPRTYDCFTRKKQRRKEVVNVEKVLGGMEDLELKSLFQNNIPHIDIANDWKSIQNDTAGCLSWMFTPHSRPQGIFDVNVNPVIHHPLGKKTSEDGTFDVQTNMHTLPDFICSDTEYKQEDSFYKPEKEITWTTEISSIDKDDYKKWMKLKGTTKFMCLNRVVPTRIIDFQKSTKSCTALDTALEEIRRRVA